MGLRDGPLREVAGGAAVALRFYEARPWFLALCTPRVEFTQIGMKYCSMGLTMDPDRKSVV